MIVARYHRRSHLQVEEAFPPNIKIIRTTTVETWTMVDDDTWATMQPVNHLPTYHRLHFIHGHIHRQQRISRLQLPLLPLYPVDITTFSVLLSRPSSNRRPIIIIIPVTIIKILVLQVTPERERPFESIVANIVASNLECRGTWRHIFGCIQVCIVICYFYTVCGY